MTKFHLVDEVEIEKSGKLKIVIAIETLTFRQIKKLRDEKETVLINDEHFKIISYEDDMLFHEPEDEFSFFGKEMFGLLVVDVDL